MSLPDRTTILIVGAGPAGLSAALSLYHRGCRDFVVVDAVAQGINASRAILVQSSAIEALESVGVNGDEFVSNGVTDSVFNVGNRSQILYRPEFERLKPYTRHPYTLIIPQNLTEHILEKKLTDLGVVIQRPMKVVGLRPNEENPLFSDVTFEDGRMITTKYVIGADGARSAIRTLTGIGFSDPIDPDGQDAGGMAQLVIADVTLENRDSDDIQSWMTMSKETLFFTFPYSYAFNETLQVPTSDRVYRIGSGVPLEDGEIPHSPSKEYLQKLVDRFGPYELSSDPSVNPSSKPVFIKEVLWKSRFRSHAAIADTFFIRLGSGGASEGGAILLAGDASHIHAVAGGQGMNLGIRDGVFVGEAVMKHIKATETQPLSKADKILREWANKRRGIAYEVIKLSKSFLAIEGMTYRKRMAWWFPISTETFRRWALWMLQRIPFAQKKLVWEVSGLARR